LTGNLEKAIAVAMVMSENVGSSPPSSQSRPSDRCWLTRLAWASASLRQCSPPLVIGGEFELRPQPLMKDMERGDDPVEDVHPDAVVPHGVETLLLRGFAHDPPAGEGLVEIADNGRGFGNEASVQQLESGRLTPRVHLQMPPLPVLADRGHVVDALVELIGDTLLVQENPQALRVRKRRRRGEQAKRMVGGGCLGAHDYLPSGW
jgi:hypothetical protein